MEFTTRETNSLVTMICDRIKEYHSNLSSVYASFSPEEEERNLGEISILIRILNNLHKTEIDRFESAGSCE